MTGRQWLHRFAATQLGAQVPTTSTLAAAATQVLVDAIARSDGARGSVVAAVRATNLPDTSSARSGSPGAATSGPAWSPSIGSSAAPRSPTSSPICRAPRSCSANAHPPLVESWSDVMPLSSRTFGASARILIRTIRPFHVCRSLQEDHVGGRCADQSAEGDRVEQRRSAVVGHRDREASGVPGEFVGEHLGQHGARSALVVDALPSVEGSVGRRWRRLDDRPG